MRFPLNLALAPARIMLAATVALHVLAAAALVQAQTGSHIRMADLAVLPELFAISAWALIGLSLLLSWRAENAKRGLSVILHDDGLISTVRAGELSDYRVDGSAVDFGWMVWLPLLAVAGPQAKRARVCRRLVLLSANLPPGQWRALRIWLRHKAVQGEDAQ